MENAKVTLTKRELQLIEYALKKRWNEPSLSDELFNEYYDTYRLIKEARQRAQGKTIEFPSKSIELI